MRKSVSSILLVSCLGAAWALPPQLQLDSLHAAMDTMSNNMESTLLGKDDLPLAVSGYMAFRLKNFQYTEPSPWVKDDRARTAVDATLNVNVVAMPNSYITLFTNLSFPFDMAGTYTNNLAKNPTNAPSNDERVLYDHSTDYYSSTLNEEFNVGVDILHHLVDEHVVVAAREVDEVAETSDLEEQVLFVGEAGGGGDNRAPETKARGFHGGIAERFELLVKVRHRTGAVVLLGPLHNADSVHETPCHRGNPALARDAVGVHRQEHFVFGNLECAFEGALLGACNLRQVGGET